MKKFWEFKNTSDTEAELLLYGEIASERPWWDWEGDTVTPKQFAEELKNLGSKSNITVRINSVGGDVFAAHAIFTQLKLNQASITVIIDGLAASAATIVAMAGDTVKIPSNAMMMIHNPVVGLLGYYSAEEMEKMAEYLEQVKESIINAYITKTGLDRKALSKMMDEETWMTGQEAVDKGFADEVLFQDVQAAVYGNFLVVNSVRHDLSKFKNIPSNLVKTGTPAGFNKLTQEPAPKPQPVNQKEDDGTVETKTVDELRKNFPDLVAQVEAAAREEGARAERQRIQAIDEISRTLMPELVNKAKYEQPMSAEQLAFEALKADAAKGRRYLEDTKKDRAESGTDKITGHPQDQRTDKEKEMEERKANAQAIAEYAKQRRDK
ncbi:MAG TPA: Clp protease ClpP [Bacillota bacterium]|nr:Clp protease ClpP [Bacillota bacterium]